MGDCVSNSYLCDSCAVWHIGCGESRIYCHERNVVEKPIISEFQAPHEVCPCWKAKEDDA